MVLLMDGFTVGVVGLGLMGGSFAKAVRGFQDCRVLGLDSSDTVLAGALADGTIDEALAPCEAGKLLAKSDVAVIALYPAAAVRFIEEHGAECGKGGVLTDLVGVKAGMLRAARAHVAKDAAFVGGHPMAGRERSGYAAATADLFMGCNYVLIEEPDTDGAALSLLEKMARHLGAGRITLSTVERHDRMIAYTSQMAHVLAAAVALHPDFLSSIGFQGGSFADITRVATLNEAMWSELFLENKEALSGALRALEEGIAGMRGDIERGDAEALRKRMRDSSSRKKEWEARAAL